jgi:excisionase family DNA binding protein
MTTTEAGKRLGVNDSRVRQYIRAGRLPAEKHGQSYMVSEEAVASLAAGLSEEAQVKRPGRKPNVTKLAARVAELEGRDGAE